MSEEFELHFETRAGIIPLGFYDTAEEAAEEGAFGLGKMFPSGAIIPLNEDGSRFCVSCVPLEILKYKVVPRVPDTDD